MLLNSLRPNIDEFFGAPELANLGENGSVIFAGDYGCGKTSAALAHAGRLVGRKIVIRPDFQAFGADGFVYYVNLEKQKSSADFLRRNVLAFDNLVGKRIFILDEAHRIRPTLQREFKSSIEGNGSNLYLFCTPNPKKLWEPLQQVCQVVELGPLADDDREKLVRRAWVAVAPGRPIPDIVGALVEYGISTPRVIIDVVEAVAQGKSPRAATAERS
jgi:DNA polymerase III delta prime subunit